MNDKLFRSVLLIEDNDIDNRINKIIIQSSDFAGTVHVATSAASGLCFLKNAVSKPEEIPDVIFLDLNMPEMNGFDFLDMFEQLDETITQKSKIIIVTSSVNSGDHILALRNPHVNHYLRKPLNTAQLLALADL